MNNIINNVPALFVEDDMIAMFLGKELLKNAGFLVVATTTAEDAVRLFKEEKYAIIFMDLELPGMNGAVAAKQIRALEKSMGISETPIFAITAHVDKKYLKHCYEMGMTEVIQKPLDDEKIKLAAQIMLNLTQEKQNKYPNKMDLDIFNFKELMESANNDPRKALLLISNFTKSLRKIKKELEVDIERQDKNEFINAVHALSSIAKHIHAPHLCDLTAQIDQQNDKSTLQDMLPLYSQLVNEILRIQNTHIDKNYIEKQIH